MLILNLIRHYICYIAPYPIRNVTMMIQLIRDNRQFQLTTNIRKSADNRVDDIILRILKNKADMGILRDENTVKNKSRYSSYKKCIFYTLWMGVVWRRPRFTIYQVTRDNAAVWFPSPLGVHPISCWWNFFWMPSK